VDGAADFHMTLSLDVQGRRQQGRSFLCLREKGVMTHHAKVFKLLHCLMKCGMWEKLMQTRLLD